MPAFLPRCTAGARLLLALSTRLPAAVPHQHFEGRQRHPIALSPDGTLLFAVNTPDSRLSVFDIFNPARHAPLLIAEIPVGLEPVSVRARSNNEVWVVNEVSDSVSIVNVPQRVVVETTRAPDEPADVVFAGGKAFVSCARNNQIRVFEAATRIETAVIPPHRNLPDWLSPGLRCAAAAANFARLPLPLRRAVRGGGVPGRLLPSLNPPLHETSPVLPHPRRPDGFRARGSPGFPKGNRPHS